AAAFVLLGLGELDLLLRLSLGDDRGAATAALVGLAAVTYSTTALLVVAPPTTALAGLVIGMAAFAAAARHLTRVALAHGDHCLATAT
ncbi:MAG TPA: hypothetical protein VF855_06085, partial [Acidimicrobiales bacterium]